MANLFLDLPLPAGNGAGAPVDVSAFGGEKTVTLGGQFQSLSGAGPSITVEVSVDGGATWSGIVTWAAPAKKTFTVAAQFMRTFVQGFKASIPNNANVDVASDDIGAQFAALPVTPAAGTGATVNVSALGTFKTVNVDGDYSGNVHIDISEDGIDFTECFTFSRTNGLKSKAFTAQFMRTRRTGVNTQLPGAATAAVGAINDATGTNAIADGSAPNCLIFRELSLLAGPVVFGTWAGLMAQLAVLKAASNGSGCYKIAFDDSLVAPFAGVTIPAAGSPHDMEGVTWDNGDFFDQTVFVNVADGATFTKLRKINGRMAITSLATGASPSPVSDFAPILEQVRLSGGATLAVTPGGVPFFDFTSLGAGGFADIFIIDSNSFLGGGAVPAVLAGPAGSFLTIVSSAVAGIAPGSIVGIAGAAVDYTGPPNILGSRSVAFLGTFTTSIFNRGPMGNVVPEPPAAAAVAPVAPDFANTIVRYDASGGAIPHILPTLPSSGGQEGGRARRMTIVEETGSVGVTVAPGAGDTINGVVTPVAVPAGGLVVLLGDGESNWYIETIFDPLGDCLRVVGPFTFPAGGALAINDIAQVDVSGGIVPLTLPAISAANSGCRIVIKKTTGGGAAFTLTPAGADTIDSTAGVSSFAGALISITIVSDGVSNWMVI